MSNKYSNQIADVAQRMNSASNKKKAQALSTLAKDKRVYDMLKANNVDAARMSARAFYASEKCIKVVHAATRDVVSIADVNENAFVAIKSLILAKRANKHITKRDIECALSNDQSYDAARADVIYQRKCTLAASTLAAQSQQCVDMIKTLRIADEVARNTFAVNDSALMQQLETAFADIAI